MNIFTANQVNQVYVLKSDSTVVANLDANNQITKSSNLGSVGLGKTADGRASTLSTWCRWSEGDLIEIANIIDIKATPASAMARS